MYGTEIFTPEKENNVQTITSMEVAGMVGKNHKELMRDIRRYISQINEANNGFINERKIALSDFFKESTYKNSQNKTQPCFDITKKGCEFIAHKLTGVKGTAFTAQYINRFHDMEQALQQPRPALRQKEAYLLKNSPTWFQRNNQKMKVICKHFYWDRKHLYHKILREISDIYNLANIEDLYISDYGHSPYYKMELVEYFQPLQELADSYMDHLMGLIKDEQW